MKSFNFSRLIAHDPAKPTLRERLAATRQKARTVIAVNRVLLRPPAKPEPAVDRIALVNYASWLFMERRMVCRELYPHMGHKADRFVLSANAAEAFHYPTGSFPDGTTTAPKPSTRAVEVLDMVGVDWRSDLTDSGRAPTSTPIRCRMRIPTKPAGDSDLKPAVIPRRSRPPFRFEAGR